MMGEQSPLPILKEHPMDVISIVTITSRAPIAKMSMAGLSTSETIERRAEIVKRCNAFPKLVAALEAFVDQSGWLAVSSDPKKLKCELCLNEGLDDGSNPSHKPHCPVTLARAALAKAGAA